MDTPNAVDQMGTYFALVAAPRRAPPRTRQALEALLIITILGTRGGAHNWVESEQWGLSQQVGLAEFLDLPHGRPSPATFGRILALLDPERLQQALVSWLRALAQRRQDSIALDGNTRRRSLDRADGHGPLPVVRAWASRNALGLAQGKVDANSTASTALPALLARLHLQGSVVTIAAMGCPVELARQLLAPGGEDGVSCKEHPPSLSEDGAELFAWLKGPHPLDEESVFGTDAQVAAGHGRVATRPGWCPSALAGLMSCERWPGLTSGVMGESLRQIGGQDEVEQRYYISALPGATDADATRVTNVIRTPWESATRGHWGGDVAMAEETNRTRQGDRAQNLALIRTLALPLWRRETSGKAGFAAKQKRAGWDHNYLLKSWHKLDAIALASIRLRTSPMNFCYTWRFLWRSRATRGTTARVITVSSTKQS